MSFLDNLNPEQREAVLHTEGPLLILAGAGSGKTRVITFRIAYLIGNGHASADEVLAVTFTNKAAGEMRERVDASLGDELRRHLAVHVSFALRAAVEAGGAAYRAARDFVIYDSSDQVAVVKQARASSASTTSSCRRGRRCPASARPRTAWRVRTRCAARGTCATSRSRRSTKSICPRSRRATRSTSTTCCSRPSSSSRRRSRFASATRRKFKYVMVDEYQDTNRPQYLLIKRLAEVHRNLAVVGDPDQSIYKWRGADLRNILDFEHDFPEAQIVRLEQNYRSTQVILDAASAVIQPEPQPQGQAALDRPQGRPARSSTTAAGRARGSRLHHAVDQAGPRRRHRHDDGGPLPHQRAVARDRRLS